MSRTFSSIRRYPVGDLLGETGGLPVLENQVDQGQCRAPEHFLVRHLLAEHFVENELVLLRVPRQVHLGPVDHRAPVSAACSGIGGQDRCLPGLVDGDRMSTGDVRHIKIASPVFS
jgi:hypothetical protein